MGSQKFIEKPIPVDEAVKRTIEATKPVKETLIVPILESVGMVLAEDVKAPYDFPPRPRSAYDGYAIRSDDTPGRLRIVGEATIGTLNRSLRLEPGTAIYVSTGAYLPEGADAVVPEEIGAKNGYIEVERKVNKWENVDPPGFYVRKGSTLLPKGYVLTMLDAVALLDVAVVRVKVYRKVRAAIIVTGNELFEPTGMDDEDKIIVNGMVAETTGKLVEWFIKRYTPWVEITTRILVPDHPDTVAWYIEKTAHLNDIILMTGGTGPSTVDTFYQVADRLNGKLLFRGLYVRGGRPTSALALDGGKLLIALSGHPISALHAAIRYLYPVLKYVGNVRRASEPPVTTYVKLMEGYRSKRPEPIKVKLCVSNGVYYATPLPKERQLSSVIASNTEADAIILTEGREHQKGEMLPAMVYREPQPC